MHANSPSPMPQKNLFLGIIQVLVFTWTNTRTTELSVMFILILDHIFKTIFATDHILRSLKISKEVQCRKVGVGHWRPGVWANLLLLLSRYKVVVKNWWVWLLAPNMNYYLIALVIHLHRIGTQPGMSSMHLVIGLGREKTYIFSR